MERLRAAMEALLDPENPRKLRQEDLAEQAGVSQSLISNFRRKQKIRIASARKLASAIRRHDLDFEWGEPASVASGYAFCGSTHCPSLRVAVLDGEPHVAPKFYRLTKSTRDNCPYCHSVMYRECPNCRATVRQKVLRCPKCKEPYVPVPDDLESLPPEKLSRACVVRNRMSEQLCRHLDDAS